MSREKPNKSEIFSEQLRIFAKKKFGNLKNLSAALGISQQHLSMYLSGKREYGASFRERLASIGFFENESGELIELKQKSNNLESLNLNNNKTNIAIDIKGAIALSNTPLERLAQLVGVAPAVLSSWQDGSAMPTPTQLSTLFNLVVALGLSAQTAAKQDPPTQATA